MKKFVATALSVLLCLGKMTVSVTAGAYDRFDVNHDGEVDIMDVIFFNRYRADQFYMPDYNRFDVDNTMTIDSNDGFCLLAKVTKNSYSTSYYSKNTGTFPSIPTTTSGTTSNLGPRFNRFHRQFYLNNPNMSIS